MKLTLLAIAAFFMLTAGSFLYFVLTWDPDKEAPVGNTSAPRIEGESG